MAKKQRPAQRQHRRRGNAMIEFSLVFTMFLAFTAGTFEIGRAIWTWASISHSVQEGARFAGMHSVENPADAPPGTPAGVNPTEAAIKEVVKKNANGLTKTQLNVQVIWSAGGVPGSDVTVTATYPFSMVVGPLLGDLSENMTITSAASSPVVN